MMRSEAGTARAEAGFGLLSSLLALMIVAVLGTTLVSVTMTDLAISANFQSRSAAFYAADSGVQQTIVDLAVDETWSSTLLSAGALTTPPETLTINGNTATAATVRERGRVIVDPGFVPFGPARSIGNASFARELFLPLPPAIIEGPDVWFTFPMRVVGLRGARDPATSVIGVEILARVDPAGGPWGYAVAAGDGWGPEALRDLLGTLQIRGSVRIFGDQANPPQVQWRGVAAVMNHYGGIADASRFGASAAKLPALDTVDVDGEMVETLYAVVNVENADFQISDYASWGQAHVGGNGRKETLDGVYIDGALTVTGAGGVHGDDSGPFREDDLDFPRLSDPFTDPATGTSYAAHQAFLDAVSLNLPHAQIDQDTAAFDLTDKSGNRIAWDPGSGTLSVEGIIKRPGALALDFTGNADNTITYAGTGTIYARDGLSINADLLPLGQYLESDNLGLISGQGISIGLKANGAAPRIMAAAYGASSIDIRGGAHIAGSLVGGYVEFYGNGGTIAQVPRLSLLPPPGMPGSGAGGATVVEIQMRDWHEQR